MRGIAASSQLGASLEVTTRRPLKSRGGPAGGRVRHAATVAVLALASLTVVPPARASASEIPAVPGSIVSEDPADWTPHVRDGQVNAIVQVGDRIVAGGVFSEVREAGRSTILPRSNIFAFDARTGAVDRAFAPQVDGAVEGLAVGADGTSVFAVGRFRTGDGTTRRRVVKLDGTTGQVNQGFRANANARVLDVAVLGNHVIVAGAFTTVNGVSRQGLAMLDATSGAVLPDLDLTFSVTRINTPRVIKIDVSPDGTRLIAIGNFQVVSGEDRKQIVMVDLTRSPAAVADWHTDAFPQVVPGTTTSYCSGSFDTYMRDVAFSPDGSYFVVATTGAYRADRLCDTVRRWEPYRSGANLQHTWVNWTGGDTLTAVAVTHSTVYVGGHQRWVNNPYRGDAPGPGAVARSGIAALDPINGIPYSWDPGRDPRGVGVFAFLVTPEGLWLGSDTDYVAGELHQKIAFLPSEGGGILPTHVPQRIPNDLYAMNRSTGQLQRSPFDGWSVGATTVVSTGVDWRQARGAFVVDGTLFYGWSEGGNVGGLYVRTFDGRDLGPPEAVDLHGLDVQPPRSFTIPGTTTRVPAFTTHLANVTGMFFDHGRLYYTVRDEPRLYYRYFTPESRVIGANLFVATTTGVDWRNVAGMTMVDGHLYYSLDSGGLYRVSFSGG